MTSRLSILRVSAPLLAFVPLVLASSRDARALTLLSDDRYVAVTRYQDPLPPVVVTATPDTPFGPFHYGASNDPANQDSELTLVDNPGNRDFLSGTVSGGTGGSSSLLRESVFSIRFRVDGFASAGVNVSGLMYGGLSGPDVTCVTLFGGATFVAGECTDPFEINFGFGTTVGAGDYELRAVARANVGDRGGGYGFTFSVSENVPEPATAVVLALGLAGLNGIPRRVRSRAA